MITLQHVEIMPISQKRDQLFPFLIERERER